MRATLKITLCLFLLMAFCAKSLASPKVILEDDFSGTKINSRKWTVRVPKTKGSFAKIENGVLHVLACDKEASIATRPAIPAAHILEFDYLQPSTEMRGGYQNNISFQTIKRQPGRWGGVLWYIERSGVTYSLCGGMWGRKETLGKKFPVINNKWYRVQIYNFMGSTMIVLRDKATGKIESKTVFQHDPSSDGRIFFKAASTRKGSRWGFKLDNVRITSGGGTLDKAPAALLPAQKPRVGKSWQPMMLAGRSFWHLAYYNPVQWKAWGMSDLPLFAESAWMAAPQDAELLGQGKRPYTLKPRGKNAASIAKNAGNEFLGFYPTLNEWGDVLLRSGPWKKMKIKSRYEGVAALEQMYKKRAASAPVSKDIFSWVGYKPFNHQACEWGARALIVETGETIPCTNLQIAFIRGAAREYGKPWGVDISAWLFGAMTNYVPVQDFVTARSGPFSGHSVSFHKRMSYVSWLTGANYLLYEERRALAVNENDVRQVYGYARDKAHDRWILSPIGDVASKLFKLAAVKDRGTPYTPVAVMVDFAHGWSPVGCSAHKIWAKLPYTSGDQMINEFFNTIFPWNPDRNYSVQGARKPGRTEQGFLTSTPYGDIFDVFTNKSYRTIDEYRVLMMVGDVRIDKALAAKLMEYVKSGGALVINAKQLGAHLPAEFVGAKLTGQSGTAKAALCKLDGKKLAGSAFSYAKVELTTAKPIITADGSGDVLACINEVGKGRVVLTTPPYFLDKKNRVLPMLGHLLKHLTSGLLPVRVSKGVEYTVNRTQDGWVVGLINNKGIYKSPTGPPKIKPEEEIAVMVRLDGVATQATEWLTGKKLKMKTMKNTTTVTLSVPVGDVRIVEFRTRQED
ncbi:MAG: hypothetical protein K8S55_08230 [Phycisphaerae bacterium]|nr:hypothetical protein [Phycisphaerae bacterium]